MVKLATRPLDATFAALSDPTRRAILARLARGEATVSTLARPFPISLPAVSKHLRVLERAGLVQRSRLGRVHLLRLAAGPLRHANEWISHYERFWQEKLDSLATVLEDTDAAGRQADGPKDWSDGVLENRRRPAVQTSTTPTLHYSKRGGRVAPSDSRARSASLTQVDPNENEPQR